MTRSLCAVALTLTVSACGGSNPGSPTAGNSGGLLEGTWNGTLSVVVRGQTYDGPFAVRFTTAPQTGRLAYRASVQSLNTWLPMVNTGDAYTIAPGTPPTVFTLSQNYASPRGACRGDFNAHGQLVTATHIEADVLGFENCGSDYTGRLVLDKQ